ncbi:MAG: tRNA epoxyqueuosine(34) reductase QueG [Chloroflexota bacterium]|nr:tRNA epoxyqueuosine(34) reductase QueG [Chloroflexota bacterium]
MSAVADPRAKATFVKERATRAGFDLARITTAEEFAFDREAALNRIELGLMDGLSWYRPARINRGASPRELLPGARSIICLGLNYFTDEENHADSITGDYRLNEGGPPLAGKIARYARGRDYHRVMKRKMRSLVEDLSQQLDSEISARWYVDDGPMLDRAAAARAGLGWFGKNTNILTSQLGSWILLGQIITDLELEPDAPVKKNCGNCVSCIDACPTGAIVAPYVIDNARCISYQTIENRGAIPREMRPLMLDWVFGCDICQEVCPVNRKETQTREPEFGRRGLAIADLTGLLQMTEDQFRARFAGTPIMRAKYSGMQRNACVALGNLKNPEAVPALAGALDSGSPLVRGHAAWALGETGTREAVGALREALEGEQDPDVLEEISEALGKCHA